MNVTVLDRKPTFAPQATWASSTATFTPCQRADDFDPFLSERWLEHHREIGSRSRQGLAKTSMYPRIPRCGNADGFLAKDRRPPGSDLP